MLARAWHFRDMDYQRGGVLPWIEMRRFSGFACTAVLAAAVWLSAPVAQQTSPLAGVWSLDRALSEMPAELGFNVNWLPSTGGGGQTAGSGGRSGGRRSGGGGGRTNAPFAIPRESYEDARRVQLLTADARNPPARLIIVDTPAAVTFTTELGQSLTLHPNGREESIEMQQMPFFVTTKRDGDRLVAAYRVDQNREVRYTYSHSANPSQLIVEVQFLERGAGEKARRVYEPGAAATETTAPAPAARPAPPGGQQQPRETLDERPGAELRGLKAVGILVEELGAQAVACGLNHDAVEAALSKRLTEGGFTVRRNSDEDTYVYVNVMTTTVASGTCASRYDAFLYTHATANLSYRQQPVLVQVSLMHRGGIGTSAPVGHAAAVTRGLEGYIDLFVSQIHDANK
jgi:hypothetical protein